MKRQGLLHKYGVIHEVSEIVIMCSVVVLTHFLSSFAFLLLAMNPFIFQFNDTSTCGLDQYSQDGDAFIPYTAPVLFPWMLQCAALDNIADASSSLPSNPLSVSTTTESGDRIVTSCAEDQRDDREVGKPTFQPTIAPTFDYEFATLAPSRRQTTLIDFTYSFVIKELIDANVIDREWIHEAISFLVCDILGIKDDKRQRCRCDLLQEGNDVEKKRCLQVRNTTNEANDGTMDLIVSVNVTVNTIDFQPPSSSPSSLSSLSPIPLALHSMTYNETMNSTSSSSSSVVDDVSYTKQEVSRLLLDIYQNNPLYDFITLIYTNHLNEFKDSFWITSTSIQFTSLVAPTVGDDDSRDPKILQPPEFVPTLSPTVEPTTKNELQTGSMSKLSDVELSVFIVALCCLFCLPFVTMCCCPTSITNKIGMDGSFCSFCTTTSSNTVVAVNHDQVVGNSSSSHHDELDETHDIDHERQRRGNEEALTVSAPIFIQV